MRRRNTATLVEMMVMLAVFALCAALCTQAFVRAEEISRRAEARDRGVTLCQSVAEVIRHNGGDPEAALTEVCGGASDAGEGWAVYYDENWALLPEAGEAGYTLQVTELTTGRPTLGKAKVEAFTLRGGEMDSLFFIEVSWQKEVGNRD